MNCIRSGHASKLACSPHFACIMMAVLVVYPAALVSKGLALGLCENPNELHYNIGRNGSFFNVAGYDPNNITLQLSRLTCCAKFRPWRYDYVADLNRTRASASLFLSFCANTTWWKAPTRKPLYSVVCSSDFLEQHNIIKSLWHIFELWFLQTIWLRNDVMRSCRHFRSNADRCYCQALPLDRVFLFENDFPLLNDL